MIAHDRFFCIESDPKYNNPYVDTDGVKWTLLDARYECGNWIDCQSPHEWRLQGPHHRSRYWVTDRLLAELYLKWYTRS